MKKSILIGVSILAVLAVGVLYGALRPISQMQADGGSDIGGGPGLRPGSGGRLSPLSGLFRDGTVIELITNTDQVSLGSSTPGSTFNLSVEDQGTATGTIYASSVFGTRGGCLQLEGPASTTFRAYATTTGPLILESGSCR